MNFQDLPVYRHRQEILDALGQNQTIIVESPTGSGKTTQLPLILKEAGYDERGIIGITQPRRIAAVSVSEFIKRQINDTGSYCAYKMRFADTSNRDTRIKIMTDGILLQEVKLDKTLSRYSVIMVDEAHERSLNIDFILGLLKEIAEVRKDLKIIISSATINAKVFSDFFDGAPVITIDSKPYEVEVRYEPAVLMRDTEDLYYEKIVQLVKRSMDEDQGDVLVFLPGEAEIKNCVGALEHSYIQNRLQIYPLYGRLSREEQEKVFTPTLEGKVKVVVSTNIAETSLTIDGIKTVIDSGMAKINFYNQKTFTSALLPMPISRASADQRKGRAGRTAPGICYRLYSDTNYEHRPEYSEEEILHSDLAEVVLRMSELEIYNTSTFPFITPPLQSALKSAEETLITIGAIEEDHHLTNIGARMILFPLVPRLSRVIVEAILNYPEVMNDVLIAVAFLSAKTPYVLPPGEELSARDAHKALSDKTYGDFVAMLKLYKTYEPIRTRKERENFCQRHYLDVEAMDEIVHIKEQIELIVSDLGIPISDNCRIPEFFCCLMAGLRQYVCLKVDKFSYRSITTDKILIHPGSAWFDRLPEFLLAGEIVKTSRMYARTVSPVRADWIQQVDRSLLAQLKDGKRRRDASGETEANGQKINIEMEMAPYIIQEKGRDGKPVYAVPVSKLSSLPVRGNVKFFLKCGDSLSRTTVSAKRIDKELSLIPDVKQPLRKKMNGTYSPGKKQFGELEEMLNYAFCPYTAGKKEFGFLAIVNHGKKYSLIPQSTITGAAKETMYALNQLIDQVPKKNQELRRKIMKLSSKLEEAMDLKA